VTRFNVNPKLTHGMLLEVELEPEFEALHRDALPLYSARHQERA
jgi:hypothetical protein